MTRCPELIQYHKLVEELIKNFDEIEFHHIPRGENKMADALATLASMFEVTDGNDVAPIKMSIRESPAQCSSLEEEVDGNIWFYDVKRYQRDRQYPEGAAENDKKSMSYLSKNFFLAGDALYKRGFDLVLLRCVDAE